MDSRGHCGHLCSSFCVPTTPTSLAMWCVCRDHAPLLIGLISHNEPQLMLRKCSGLILVTLVVCFFHSQGFQLLPVCFVSLSFVLVYLGFTSPLSFICLFVSLFGLFICLAFLSVWLCLLAWAFVIRSFGVVLFWCVC